MVAIVDFPIELNIVIRIFQDELQNYYSSVIVLDDKDENKIEYRGDINDLYEYLREDFTPALVDEFLVSN